MDFTIAELARAVGKRETYVRQHIHRKHLAARKEGRNVSVALDEAVRWARERGLSFVPPARALVTTDAVKGRTARMTVLAWHAEGGPSYNLFTFIRHRRRDALGPWASEPDETWASEDVGHGLRLFSFDASFERCQALIDHILGSGTLEIDDLAIHYALKPVPRRHWAYRDRRPEPDASVLSPFSRHSAEIIEYWSFTAEPRERWLKVLGSLSSDDSPSRLARLGFPLARRPDRVGNLMIAGAEDAIACDLVSRRDRTLRLQVDANGLLPGAYRAVVWASHSHDEVLRREVAVTAGQTVIELASEVDHIGFEIYRTVDGQCVDLMEVFLIMNVGIHMEVSGPTLDIQDRRGRSIHQVNSSDVSMIEIQSDDDRAELDKGIRRLWLDRRVREREADARREGNFVRFRPEELEQAIRYFIGLLRRDAHQKEPIYLADPYFTTPLEGIKGKGLQLYLDLFSATNGRPLRILCAQRKSDNAPPWWSSYPKHLMTHVRVRSFVERDESWPGSGEHKPGFHDRYLITLEREILITNSFNGWLKHGVTFASHPYGVYRAEAEQLWSMDVGSTTAPLLVREIL